MQLLIFMCCIYPQMYAHDEFGSWKGGVKVPFTTSTYLAPGEGSV